MLPHTYLYENIFFTNKNEMQHNLERKRLRSGVGKERVGANKKFNLSERRRRRA
jgi:hypothetical protein